LDGKDHLRHLKVDGDNIKMNLKEIGCDGMDWIELIIGNSVI
jgi:hypothetical protein